MILSEIFALAHIKTFSVDCCYTKSFSPPANVPLSFHTALLRSHAYVVPQKYSPPLPTLAGLIYTESLIKYDGQTEFSNPNQIGSHRKAPAGLQ